MGKQEGNSPREAVPCGGSVVPLASLSRSLPLSPVRHEVILRTKDPTDPGSVRQGVKRPLGPRDHLSVSMLLPESER